MEIKEEKAQPPAVRQVPSEKAPAKPRRKLSPQKKPARKAPRVLLVKSKRKRAVARASVRSGTGSVRINNRPLRILESRELRMFIMDPINVSGTTRSTAASVDISINVKGGGTMTQAEAARSAIAKALSAFSDSDVIRKEYLRYDRALLADDPRRVEPKKYLGTKARARFQTSYR